MGFWQDRINLRINKQRVRTIVSIISSLYNVWKPNRDDNMKFDLRYCDKREVVDYQVFKELGIPLADYPMYIGFCKQLAKYVRKFRGKTLKNKYEELIQEYTIRGLKRNWLLRIAGDIIPFNATCEGVINNTTEKYAVSRYGTGRYDDCVFK